MKGLSKFHAGEFHAAHFMRRAFPGEQLRRFAAAVVLLPLLFILVHPAAGSGAQPGIASWGLHSAALKEDGTLRAWGKNAEGQAGDNTTTERWTPVQVLGPGGVGILDLGDQAGYSYYLPWYISDSDYWTGVGLKDGIGWFTASVTATVYESTGTVLATKSRSINPRGQAAFMVGSGLNRQGWVKVTSDEPLTGFGFIALAHDDKLMFDISFVSELATMLYVPRLAQDTTWDTIVYVCNQHDSETTMYLTLVRSNGTLVVSKKSTLPANGIGAYSLSELAWGGSYTSGSIEITASRGVAGFALYHNLKTGDRSYAGISAVKP